MHAGQKVVNSLLALRYTSWQCQPVVSGTLTLQCCPRPLQSWQGFITAKSSWTTLHCNGETPVMKPQYQQHCPDTASYIMFYQHAVETWQGATGRIRYLFPKAFLAGCIPCPPGCALPW